MHRQNSLISRESITTQEGFYVLEGEGYAKLDDLVFPIKKGDSFVALAGVAHTIRTKEGCEPVKVFWFHSAK